MTQSIEQLPGIDLAAAFASSDDFDRVVTAAHKNGPFAKSFRGLEVIGYKECAALLRDRRLNSDHMGLVEAMGFPEGPARDFKKAMLLSHGRDAYRTRIRQALMRAIGPSVIEEQRPMIRQLAIDLLQGVETTETIDLLNDFAFILPASLFCHWFGAPLGDARWVADLSDRVLKIFSNDPSYTPAIIAAYDELFPYVQARIDAGLASPQDNLLGNFITEHRAGQLSELELFHIVAMFNEASTDNTAHGIATGIGRLAGDKQRWEQVIDNPELIPDAFNEVMRLYGRINTLVRYASEDLEYEGVTIPKGTPVFFVIPAAHRDPNAFSDPLEYDPMRAETRNALDFGGGVYSCLGKHVALVEIQETIAELASNFPNIRVENFNVNTNMFVNEVSELSVQLRG